MRLRLIRESNGAENGPKPNSIIINSQFWIQLSENISTFIIFGQKIDPRTDRTQKIKIKISIFETWADPRIEPGRKWTQTQFDAGHLPPLFSTGLGTGYGRVEMLLPLGDCEKQTKGDVHQELRRLSELSSPIRGPLRTRHFIPASLEPQTRHTLASLNSVLSHNRHLE